MPLLDVQNLSVAFRTNNLESMVVHDVSFTIDKGEVVAIIGESGSGKSVTALSIMRLLPYPAASHPTGHIIFDEKDLLTLTNTTLRQIRGSRISMIFQEPMTSLNPLHTIDKQIGEVLRLHTSLAAKDIRERIMELLDLVQLSGLKTRMNAYPHELSGGQRQRVMIAMALICNPALLIADEPTTALDVTIQMEIIKLLKKIQAERNMAMLFITHDLTIVQKIATRVCVMYQGTIVEQGTIEQVLKNPEHPYTRHLLAAQPTTTPLHFIPDAKEILSVANMNVAFPAEKKLFRPASYTRVLQDISLSLKKGQTLGIVGESGSGKSTLAMAILRLIPMSGMVVFMGKHMEALSRNALRDMRKELQIVFQDPFASLNPRMSVAQIIGEGLKAHGMYDEQRVDDVLTEVALSPDMKTRYPHEFSGGQRQRIAIARALALNPSLIILDEPTSALDISVQAQIIDLLRMLQQKHTLSILFISHDLRVIRALSHEVVVLKDGKIIEQGKTSNVLEHPETEYTRSLVANSL